MEIVESFSVGKNGVFDDNCENLFVKLPDFVAVIDGVGMP
jgi:hypothetical protein